MKTTDLLNANPERRSQMVVDAYKHLASKMELLALDIRILNSWLTILPGQLSTGEVPMPDIDKLMANTERYELASDEMTAQVIDNAHNLKRFLDAAIFYEKYGEIKTVIE